MMQLLSSLRGKILLNEEDLQSLKTYIQKKYPDASPRDRAAVLADAVHRVLDGKMPLFPQTARLRIRRRLMEEAVARKRFVIDAGDVFWVSLNEDVPKVQRIDALWLWLAREQGIDLPRGELQLIVDSLVEKIVAENISDFEGLLPSLAPPAISGGLPENSNQAAIGQGAEAGVAVVAAPSSAMADSPSASTVKTDKELQKARRLNEPSREKRGWMPAAAACLILLLISLSVLFRSTPFGAETVPGSEAFPAGSVETTSRLMSPTSNDRHDKNTTGNELPPSLRYRSVREDALRQWLNQRNSLLAEEPYFSVILQTAKAYDIHPLFLFAITGQEQAFVPRTDTDARKIANNPFNVYKSWRKYNTRIQDSAEIAAVTIVSLSKNRPEGADPVAWINTRYSEDERWYIGVNSLFSMLVREVGEKEEVQL
ncbi:hypothetical protein GTO91_17395 [Heliobacterium undosum]|uniref:Uncharacterized protein n=1 Tax=Heliomicrobium undosum TaxID=121734 RepID=A0A845L845_9FIRM|nr:hypothetical protein [Heliomicrobium undosum]MZP31469.1 hypothetical protein [Heliomicrobium undosum]